MKIRLFSVAALVGCIASTGKATPLTQYQAATTNYLAQSSNKIKDEDKKSKVLPKVMTGAEAGEALIK